MSNEDENKELGTDTANISNTKTTSIPKPQISAEDTDPLMIRDTDTSKLKRVTPKTQNINLDGDNYTDTVHLKVIKERKKQLSGILTASQTIRLRPPSAGGTVHAKAASGAANMDVSMPPSGGGTLKVADPSNTDTGTIKVSGPAPSAPASAGTLRVKAPVTTNTQPTSAGTLKIKAPVTTNTQPTSAGTLKIQAPTAPAANAAAGTLKIKSPTAPASGGGTLKIKSSGPTEGASGTLKIKSPSSASDETLKVSSQSTGGTLKLKTNATQRGAAPATAPGRAGAQSPDQLEEELFDDVDPRAVPGFISVFLSMAATGVLGFMLFQNLDQYYKMFTVLLNK